MRKKRKMTVFLSVLLLSAGMVFSSGAMAENAETAGTEALEETAAGTDMEAAEETPEETPAEAVTEAAGEITV